MYISLPCLQNLININHLNSTLDSFDNKIGLAGFEIEETVKEEILKRANLRVKIATTANRSDVLCLIGLSREISYIFQTNWIQNRKIRKILSNSQRTTNNNNDINWNQKLDSACIEFFYLNINLNNSIKIPRWIKRRLNAANFSTTDTLLDLTNYVMLEWGCSFQSYDLDKLEHSSKIKEKTFTIEKLYNVKESVTSYKDQKYLLRDSTLVDKYNEVYIGTSGTCIKNGFEITKDSENILVCAYSFSPKQMRQSIRSSGIQNEQTIRHEKQIGYTNLYVAITRLKTLISFLSPTAFLELNSFKTIKRNQEQSKLISIRFSSVLNTLGNLNTSSVEEQQKIIAILIKNLGLKVKNINFKKVDVVVPFYRQEDLKEEIDIIEELARGFGFNNFQSYLPSKEIVGKLSKTYCIEEKIRKFLINFGLFETYHSSFCSTDKQGPSLLNPLNSEISSIRSTLINEFISQYNYNKNNNKTLINYFEFGSTFAQDSKKNLLESRHVGGIFGENISKDIWIMEDYKLDWFKAFGLIKSLLNYLKIDSTIHNIELSKSTSYLHPYRAIEIRNNKKVLGYFGNLHPKILAAHNIEENLYVFELDLEKITKVANLNSSSNLKYAPYSKLPSMSYNFILKLDACVNYALVEKEIKNEIGRLLNSIQIFDIKQNKSNLLIGIKIILQSDKETLIKKNMDNKIELARYRLKEKYGIQFL